MRTAKPVSSERQVRSVHGGVTHLPQLRLPLLTAPCLLFQCVQGHLFRHIHWTESDLGFCEGQMTQDEQSSVRSPGSINMGLHFYPHATDKGAWTPDEWQSRDGAGMLVCHCVLSPAPVTSSARGEADSSEAP